MVPLGTEVGGSSKSAGCRELGDLLVERASAVCTGGPQTYGYDPEPSKPPTIPFSNDRQDTSQAFE